MELSRICHHPNHSHDHTQNQPAARIFGSTRLVFSGYGSAVVAALFPAEVVVQVTGSLAGAVVLYLIARGKAGFSTAGGFASTGTGEHSRGGDISNYLQEFINQAKQ